MRRTRPTMRRMIDFGQLPWYVLTLSEDDSKELAKKDQRDERGGK